MNLLLTGATGYVGQLIRRELGNEWAITGVGAHASPESGCLRVDLAEDAQIQALGRKVSPDVIVHAAGDKNLARCEADPEGAYRANVQTTLNLIRTFPGTPIIFISSDYVFPGNRGGYREDDSVGPTTVYGRTKACAELAGLILSPQFNIMRLSALYDQNATFVKFLRESLERGTGIPCFEDAFYSPTYYRDFIAVLKRLVEKPSDTRRIYHVCGHRTSRYFFAKLFARTAGFDEALILRARRNHETSPFLFPDLSLDNTHTRETLDIAVGSHEESLSILGKHHEAHTALHPAV